MKKSSRVRKSITGVALMIAMLAGGVASAPAAGAQEYYGNTFCNDYWGAGNGYYGCDSLQSAWDTGKFESYTYYW